MIKMKKLVVSILATSLISMVGCGLNPSKPSQSKGLRPVVIDDIMFEKGKNNKLRVTSKLGEFKECVKKRCEFFNLPIEITNVGSHSVDFGESKDAISIIEFQFPVKKKAGTKRINSTGGLIGKKKIAKGALGYKAGTAMTAKKSLIGPMGGGLSSYCGPLDLETGKDNCCSAIYVVTNSGFSGFEKDPSDPDCQ